MDYAIPENDSTTVYDLAARVASADGKTVFYDRATKWTKAKSPLHWITEAAKAPPPLDFLFAYYPSWNRMRHPGRHQRPAARRQAATGAGHRAEAGRQVNRLRGRVSHRRFSRRAAGTHADVAAAARRV